jgi:hypothetical protein
MMRLIVPLILTLLIFSCQKPEDRACWKSVGEKDSLELFISNDFEELFLAEHLEYVLVQDSTDKVVLKGGRNLLNFVEVVQEGQKVSIRNNNKCSFLRNLKEKVQVEIHFTSLINIHYEGTEFLKNEGQLKLNWFTLLIRDGAGPVDLNIDAEAIYFNVTHGYGDFTLSGKTKYANLLVKSNGFCDTYGLNIIDSITVISNTMGLCKVNVDQAKFKAEIDNGGDIWYIGTPFGQPKLLKYGTGELIDKN